MKVAVTFDDGQVFQHFGHSRQFKVYEIENGEIINTEMVDITGEGHGALAVLLKDLGIKKLICGGIGEGARNALTEADVEFYPGVKGDADQRVKELLLGTLSYNPDTVCAHHKDGHEEHSCGGTH